MWPFRSGRDDAEMNSALRRELEEADETIIGLHQKLAAAQTAMAKMQKAATPEGLDEIARSLTARVADIYAQGWPRVRDRDAAVSTIIHRSFREAMQGEAAWNARQLAAAAYKEQT